MGIFKGAKQSITRLISSQKRLLAERTLASKLKKIVDIVDGHKDQGLPAGHTYYVVLWTRAKDLIDQFCSEYGTTFDQVAIGSPRLKEVQEMANGSSSRTVQIGGTVGLVAVASGIVGIVLTCALALYHNVYLILTYWANVHFRTH